MDLEHSQEVYAVTGISLEKFFYHGVKELGVDSLRLTREKRLINGFAVAIAIEFFNDCRPAFLLTCEKAGVTFKSTITRQIDRLAATDFIAIFMT